MAEGITGSDNTNNRYKNTPIAIIGMASIFPQAENLQQYWENILNKLDCITDVPASRWKLEDYYDPDPKTPDKTYCKRGAFIPDVDFDPAEFGLPPNILEATDVSQLLSMLVAKNALEDAGYGESSQEVRDRTGVILGTVVGQQLMRPLMSRLQYPVWQKVLKSCGLSQDDTDKVIEKMKKAYVGWEENSFPGFLSNVIAGRIANRLDLGGINFVVDAACASSLSAAKMAVNELITGSCDMIITGGVDIDNSILTYMCFAKTPAFSRQENTRPFDVSSDGMMAGEGIGMLVLKRLEDAERDGDRIYAVIKGVGASSDGRYKSIYAPRSEGQVKAIERAYAEAGVEPATVGLIEAHGTGTVAGDIAEVGGLSLVFGSDGSRKNQVALGSVKSQIGHTKAAAGSASLIKTALALYHKVLPASINVTEPNPKLKLDQTPFYINTEVRPWFRNDENVPRRAGVSSFGFGGTNFHVLMEEYTGDHNEPYRLNRTAQTILIEADNPAALLARSQDILSKLTAPGGNIFLNELAVEAQNLVPAENRSRLGFVAVSPTEAQELLKLAIEQLKNRPNEEAWELPQGVYYRKQGLKTAGKVVALFSGQGSQYLEMGRELALNLPVVRETLGTVNRLFQKDGLPALTSVLYPPPLADVAGKKSQEELLQRTDHAQPAIGAISSSLYKLLNGAGFQADFAAGHSFGELTALWSAGVISDEDYLALAKARGKAMAAPAGDPNFDAGTMLAVSGDLAKLPEALKNHPDVVIANHNSPQQAVLAGSKPAIAAAKDQLAQQGYSVVQLPVSAAFHTKLVGHATAPFEKAVKAVKFNAPKFPVFSNSSAKAYPEDPAQIQKILVEHLLNPVYFAQEIENIHNQGGYFFIEFGPRDILTNLVKKILGNKPYMAVALNGSRQKDSDLQLRRASVQLRVAGLPMHDFDCYQAKPAVKPAKKPSVLNMKLNGSNYINPARTAAFEAALKDGFKLQMQEAPRNDNGKAPEPVVVPAPAPAPQAPQQEVIPTEEVAPLVAQPVQSLEALENSLNQFGNFHSGMVRVHEQYLNNQEAYTSGFFQLMQQQQDLLLNGKVAPAPGLVESIERNMMRFHDYQSETLRVHNDFLRQQTGYSQDLFHSLSQQPAGGYLPSSTPQRPVQPVKQFVEPSVKPEAPVKNGHVANVPNGHPVSLPAQVVNVPAKPEPTVVAPVANVVAPAPVAPVKPGVSTEQLSKSLMAIVSDKTGYPVEMLEPGMDMEADLGIDSIKRVEILGAMQDQYPDLPKLNPDELAELRTLGQIIEKMASAVTVTSGSAPVATTAPATAPASVPASAPVAAGVATDELAKSLMAIVSEKTGYPVEMLEPGMDMEADLGIDSIKRVEILGAMQDQYPNLPKLNPDELAELRTLGQIIEKMAGSVPTAPVAEITAPVAVAPAATSAPAASSQNNLEELAKALMVIVSDKTGYPVEMLEPGMDMEADLGIDSIKRVEILGAMQDQYPNLPKLNPDELAELRTLGQITEKLGGSALAAAPVATTVEEVAPELPTLPEVNITRGIVRLKYLPEPDRLEFKLAENRCCLLTDDGSATTGKLAQALKAQGWKVVVLSFPPSLVPTAKGLPENINRVALQDISEGHLEQTLKTVAERYGQVGAFIHLNPTFPGTGAIFQEREKSIIRQVFLIAKHLKKPLNEAAKRARALFVTVTHLDGQLGLSGNGEYGVIEGGLFGLTKTMNQEWEKVYCRAVDLSPELADDQAVKAIVAELYDPNLLVTEVGYNSRGRFTLINEEAVLSGKSL